jgi:hypothetical protein
LRGIIRASKGFITRNPLAGYIAEQYALKRPPA